MAGQFRQSRFGSLLSVKFVLSLMGAVGRLVFQSQAERKDAVSKFGVGDFVVYRKTKFSQHPGPRAQDIEPSVRGEAYSYVVEKYWIVTSVDGGELTLQTRTGKCHTIQVGDPNLRKANWVERLLRRNRFPQLKSTE